ncbi:MAG: phosphotransferase family protein [Alphaproteobacteria bacterium]
MPLGPFIREAAGADSVTVEDGNLLTGGAIQENRALTVVIHGGEFAGTHDMVLRAEAAATIAESRPLDQQFALLQVAETAGVTVPKPFWYCGDASVAGKPFYLMQRIDGEALGIRITRQGEQRDLAAALGDELAKIHSIQPPQAELGFLDAVAVSPALDAIAKYRAYLDALPEPHPVLEWTLRWLETRAPAAGETVLCHRDFRTGNYMVYDGELTGVLDWEFAGWGDPHEDIAWFCARCWRFSGPRLEAGGIADRNVFYNAYERASGRTLDRDLIAYWETMGHVRWAVIALQQSMRHRSGDEPSLELALIGRRLAELEYECLRLTGAMT